LTLVSDAIKVILWRSEPRRLSYLSRIPSPLRRVWFLSLSRFFEAQRSSNLAMNMRIAISQEWCLQVWAHKTSW